MQPHKDMMPRTAKRQPPRRSVIIEVDVQTFSDATVYLDKIPTDDLMAELNSRTNGCSGWASEGELEDGFAVFTLDTHELRTIRQLYLVGHEAVASARCRQLLADLLGTAL